MRISQILLTKRSDVISIAPDATIRSAIALMRRERVGALLVVDEHQHLLGVVAERDIIHGLDAEGANLMGTAVRRIMRTDGPVTTLDETVRSVMEVMTSSRARHVPVVQRGHLVGVVSIGDIVKSRLDETIQENSILQDMARAHWLTG